MGAAPLAKRRVTARVLGGRPVTTPFYRDMRPRRGRYAFSFADWSILTGPLVYAWVDRRDVNYVGMSTRGFARVLTPKHHAIRRFDHPMLQPRHGMRLYIWPAKDAAEAKALERKLIVAYRPYLNRVGKAPLTPRADEPLNPNEPPLAAANRRLRSFPTPRRRARRRRA